MTYSDKLAAVRARIRRLPSLIEGVASASRMRDADRLIYEFRYGLKDSTLSLAPLRPKTVSQKSRRGYSNPSSPLYAKGLEGAKTYAKSLRAFRRMNGWAVRVMDSQHWSGRITNRALFLIHEYGATWTNRSGSTRRLPARPAMAVAYRKVLRQISASDANAEMQRAISEALRTGRSPTADRAVRLAAATEARYG